MKKYIPYLLLIGPIMLPLLSSGYIFTLDMVFTPELRMPDAGSGYLWHGLLYVLNQFLPSQLIQKAILTGILLASCIGMHRLLEYLTSGGKAMGSKSIFPAALPLRVRDEVGIGSDTGSLAIYIASILYAVNPFTYARFMAGHYAVLLGYALIPFFVRALLRFLAAPTRKTLLQTVGMALLISIVSIHTLGSVVIITLVIGGIALWQHRNRSGTLKAYARLGLAGVGIFVLASYYWLFPLLAGEGETARMLQQFDESHTHAFATTGSNVIVQILHVLQLQGFWAEPRGLFLLPQEQLIGWGTLRLALWALVIGGLVICWRRARILGTTLIILLVIATLLAVGIPEHVLTNLGYREPHKFTGLVAFVFALCVAVASARLLHHIRQRSEIRYGLTATALLLIVVLFTPTMYWGFGGQLRPRQYPNDWYTLNDRLNQDTDDFQTVFVPWHQYMSFDFAGRIIANPATHFFDKPVIVSNNPELENIKQPTDDRTKKALHTLLSDKNPTDVGSKLADYDIKYVVLAKEYDYRNYRYLKTQRTLTVVWDTPTITLYRNTAWEGHNASE
jgi:hypothetical protein